MGLGGTVSRLLRGGCQATSSVETRSSTPFMPSSTRPSTGRRRWCSKAKQGSGSRRSGWPSCTGSICRRARGGSSEDVFSSSRRTQGNRLYTEANGALAQLGEHRLCKPEVTGSIPVRSTPHNQANSATKPQQLGNFPQPTTGHSSILFNTVRDPYRRVRAGSRDTRRVSGVSTGVSSTLASRNRRSMQPNAAAGRRRSVATLHFRRARRPSAWRHHRLRR
jgi:hypothetical protein